MSERPRRPPRRRAGGDDLARTRADNLRQLLLKASRNINHDVAAALRGAGFADLKNSQVFCLAHIDLDGTGIVELAERCNISKQAASKLVAELVALGYLTTARAPADGRAILVRFTPDGRAMMQRSFELFAELELRYSRRVGAHAYRILKQALRELGARPHSR